jgi:pimeloyl-ACP methyl ester carboxylesterase
MTAYRTIDVDGVDVFYRETGDPGAPTLLLRHGFPTSSTQYPELMDRLSDRFHLVAPDYPGFGYTEPLEGTTTFDRLADIVDGSSTPSPWIIAGCTCSTSARPSDSA